MIARWCDLILPRQGKSDRGRAGHGRAGRAMKKKDIYEHRSACQHKIDMGRTVLQLVYMAAAAQTLLIVPGHDKLLDPVTSSV